MRLGRFPAWADDPRLLPPLRRRVRRHACADGKGSHPLPPAERQTFRKQALDLLSAELAGLAKLAASDPEFVQAGPQAVACRRRSGERPAPKDRQAGRRGNDKGGKSSGRASNH